MAMTRWVVNIIFKPFSDTASDQWTDQWTFLREVSPPFELSFGHKFPSVTCLGSGKSSSRRDWKFDQSRHMAQPHGAATWRSHSSAWLRFKMMIYPEMVNEGKGGSCFRTKKTVRDVIFSTNR